jgi:O-succinylbenzoic acid--CoA ligase
MFQLKYRQHTFQKPEDFIQTQSGYPDFLKEALAFCLAWKNGETQFHQQTSGSTGVPKSILLDRSQMEASAKATQGFFKIDKVTKLLCCLNPAYIAGKMMLVRAMVWDAPIQIVAASSDPLSELNLDELPDFVAMVPLQVENSLEKPESLQKLQKIKHVIIGGAPLSQKLKSKIVKHGIAAWQTFGMTETVSHIALARITEEPELLYNTLPDVEISTDSNNALWIKSPMSGPQKIQTNDQIELLSPNQFIWKGRLDFVINSGGVKIHPEQVENKIEDSVQAIFPDTRFLVSSKKDESLGQKVVLFLERDGIEADQAENLKKQLELVLSRFERPKEIICLPKFPETANGKLARKSLLE